MVRDVSKSYNYLKNLNSKNDFIAKAKILALCVYSKINTVKAQLFSSKGTSNYTTKVTDKNSVEDIDGLALDIDAGYFTIKQDLEYITWRLANNPYHNKIFNVYFRLNAKVVGSISLNHHQGGVWYLVNEFYRRDLSERIKLAMLNESVRLLFKQEKCSVSLVRTWDFCHNGFGRMELDRRERAGFIHLNRGIPFVWKSLDEKGTLNANDFILSRIASQGVI